MDLNSILCSSLYQVENVYFKNINQYILNNEILISKYWADNAIVLCHILFFLFI